AAHRRRRRGSGVLRGLRPSPQSRASRPHQEHRGRRLRTGDHGHRPGPGQPAGAGACRPPDRRYGGDRAQRSLRRAGPGLCPRSRPRPRASQARWRRAGARSPPGGLWRAHYRQGGGTAEADGRPPCPGHHVHRRRAGHRHGARSGPMIDIRKVAVIGAGIMGRGTAAHVANAGVPVLLLDIVPAGATNRNALAESALAALRSTQPAAFMHPKNARLVTPGNVEDHLGWLADVDWAIEAGVEDLDAKRAIYPRLPEFLPPESIVSSNTSTIPLQQLIDGLPPAFAQRFLITHFFNPPRYMRLLELVAGERTRPEVVAALHGFADLRLGKGVVPCRDRPG